MPTIHSTRSSVFHSPPSYVDLLTVHVTSAGVWTHTGCWTGLEPVHIYSLL